MALKAVVIELRPNLSCGLAFLQFDEHMGRLQNTHLVINDDGMHILQNVDGEDRKIVLCHNSFGMDVKHISLFNSSGCHVSFRFNYTKIDLDKLYKTGSGPIKLQPMPMRLRFEQTEHVALHCNKCKGELVPGRIYHRMRELPSGLIDPSEFFCHNHNSSGQQRLSTLVPGENDIYYGLNHIVLNILVLHDRINNISGYLFCKRCMWLLGTPSESGAAAKLWADALRFLPSLSENRLYPIFQYATVTQLMLRMLHDLGPHGINPQGQRAVLVATMPNLLKHYMIIQVPEKHLAVLRRIVNDVRSDEMCFYFACKLYFRVFGQCQNSTRWLEKFEKHHKELNVPKISISPYLFTELQNRFDRNATLVPDDLRFDNFDEHLMATYFFYESDEQERLYQKMPYKPSTFESAPPIPKSQILLNEKKYKKLNEWVNVSADDADNESDDELSVKALKSKLLQRSAPIMAYEKNLAKRWQQTPPEH